jgi:alpha-glucosidase (family GH31 glycosyl hydrolase)
LESPILAGYYVTTDEELYVRYFQLAVISPLAWFNDDTPTLQYHPFKLSISNQRNLIELLEARLSTFNYMRTELYKIS